MQGYRRAIHVIGAVVAFVTMTGAAAAQARVDPNVVYGMHSGTALLLDVHVPAKPNGLGIVFIAGSGWRASLDYSAPPLKESPQVAQYAPSLLAAGYTVFALSHRATPAFKYPAPIEDVQRAVRFIRHNAAKYGIDPARIGALGGSSGGHLVSMLGTLDGSGVADDADPVNRQSARVQCVVARAAPVDLFKMSDSGGAAMVAMLLGSIPMEPMPKTSVEYKTASAASPVTHVTKDDPPFLLVHGDADRIVPYPQSEAMEAALKRAGVPVKLLRIEGADHGPDFPGAKNPPDYKAEMVKWFDTYLRRSGS